ncbi:hypothetical protein FRB94_010076 [Tulasnella sp. JGI-2019a]|nr:hypothetical protein FRB94_010076 [Tulasnella sp. JGI-2019a]
MAVSPDFLPLTPLLGASPTPQEVFDIGKLPALDTGDVTPAEPPSPSVSGVSSTFTTSASNLGKYCLQADTADC